MMNYKPSPIDTSSVKLTGELEALTEKLAEHIHDLWAEERLAQGWSFGAKRDDDKKLHPCLIPYSELPESEKGFDRATALGAIKAIVSLGYKITRPETT